MISALIVILLSVIGGILYRLGGAAKTGRWYDPLCHTKTRDFGVPACMVIAMIAMGSWHWSLFLCFGALFGAMTTYWKKKGSDANALNWTFTGLSYGVAMLPYHLFQDQWIAFILRTVIVTVLVVLVSVLSDNDVIEENGRGFATIATLLFYK